MLSRRTLIGSTAVLAAGCGGLDIPFPVLGPPKITPLTWVSRSIAELNTGPGIASFEEKLRRMERNLADDDESPFGPERGRYSLALQYVERYAGSYSDPDAEQFRKPEHLAAWLDEVDVDLVTERRARSGRWASCCHWTGSVGHVDPSTRLPIQETARSTRCRWTRSADAPLRCGLPCAGGCAPPDSSWDWDGWRTRSG